MPLYTEYYHLGIKLANEGFSASLDRARFLTIDSLMGFVCDLIGDGLIVGWQVASSGAYQLAVTSGMGLITRFNTRTFGPIYFTLPSDGVYYLFMQRSPNIIGGFSDFSAITSFTAVVTTPPTAPTGLSVSAITSSSISFDWTANTASNVAYYCVYRTTDNINGWTSATPIAEPVVSTYMDTGLSDWTHYYYRVTTVDSSGNESDYAAISAMTLEDLHVPSDPSNVMLYGANAVIQATWLSSSDPTVVAYVMTLQPLTISGDNTGTATVQNVASTVLQTSFTGLSNGTAYRITVQAQTLRNVLSIGIYAVASPALNAGPTEIAAVNVAQSWNGTSVTLTVSWTPATGVGVVTPSSYILTLIEAGLYQSTISVNAGTARAISVINGTSNGSSFSRPIQQYTFYSLRVQGVSAAGVANVGYVTTFQTQQFSDPDPASDASIVLSNNSNLLITWTNPTTAFYYVALTLVVEDLTTSIFTTLLNNVNIGTSTSYTFTPDAIALNSVYTASLVTYDVAGNMGTSSSATLPIPGGVPAPAAPSVVLATSSIGCVNVQWTESTAANVAAYKVWRALGNGGMAPSSFILLDTVSADTLGIVDYDIIVGTFYGYLVTTVDIYGNESHGPADGSFLFNISLVTANYASVLNMPQNVQGVLSGNNYTLTWSSSSDYFDGWQIYRAVNNYDFSLIGAVTRVTPTFTDTNLNMINGQRYSYLVREYRNEASLSVESDSELIAGTLFIGQATVVDGAVTIDSSQVVQILNIEGPVLAATEAAIALHHHTYNSDTDDRRIQLGNSLTVSNWTSPDLYVYSTTTNISTFPDYTVLVNGLQTDLLYEMDLAAGQITFETTLQTTDIVSVVFANTEEVQGILPSSKISFLTATNFTQDVLNPGVLPQISHEGRIGEKLLPQTVTYLSSDFQYYDANGANFYGNVASPSLLYNGTSTMTFYDILPVDDSSTLLAATSDGIFQSIDSGYDWSILQTTARAATRLIFSGGTCFAACGSNVLIASDLLTNWQTVDGLEGVGIIRDLAADTGGCVYATTDVGVYVYDSTMTIPQWSQCTLPDYGSSQAYVCFYDTTLAAIVVSTDSGLFFTSDKGNVWTLWNAFPTQRAIFAMIRVDDVLYALAETRLYRKRDTDSQFAQISAFSANSRKLAMFIDRLYVSTEIGTLASTGDVANDPFVTFTSILPQLSEGNNCYVMTSLYVWGSRLLLGTENSIYLSTLHGSASLLFQLTGTYAPSIFVNGVLRSLGVFTTLNSVTFDERLSPEDDVQVSNQYLAYKLPNGGWADVSFASPVTVYYNGEQLNDPTVSAYPTVVNGDIVIPALTNRNSNFAVASPLIPEITAAGAVVSQGAAPANVSSLFSLVDQLNANIDSSIDIVLPSIPVVMYNGTTEIGSYDASYGTFSFTTDITVNGILLGVQGNPYLFTKYSDLRANISGVTLLNEGDFTHDQIDDQIETKLSGLDAKFAAVSQVNLINTDIFIERTWPNERETLSPRYQMNISAGCDNKWYDQFNSTVDFVLRVRKNPVNISLNYPSCVMDVPERGEVWVGGYGGIIAIEKADLDTDPTINSVYSAPSELARFMLNDTNQAYTIVGDAIYTISFADLSVARDSGVGLGTGVTSLVIVQNNLIAGCSDGVYLKTGGEWQNVLQGINMVVNFLGNLIIAYDQSSNTYSSATGTAWTNKGNPITSLAISNPSITSPFIINGTARFGSVFFATNNGLFEDNFTFYSQVLRLKNVNLSGETSNAYSVNDIAVNGNLLAVGLSDGRYYTYESGGSSSQNFSDTQFSFTEYDANPLLDAIHRVEIIDGSVWLFGFDKLNVVNSNIVVKLATGKRLTWQRAT